MKNTVKMFISALVLATAFGCTSFNRDALWNAPIKSNEYCTYYQEDFPKGSTFVHRQDDWTEKRLSKGYELKVVDVVGGNLLLDHGWTVFNGTDYLWHKPILVNPTILDEKQDDDAVVAAHEYVSTNYAVGTFFKDYGQYKYVDDVEVDFDGERITVKYFEKISDSQELAAEPYPFFYFRH